MPRSHKARSRRTARRRAPKQASGRTVLAGTCAVAGLIAASAAVMLAISGQSLEVVATVGGVAVAAFTSAQKVWATEP